MATIITAKASQYAATHYHLVLLGSEVILPGDLQVVVPMQHPGDLQRPHVLKQGDELGLSYLLHLRLQVPDLHPTLRQLLLQSFPVHVARLELRQGFELLLLLLYGGRRVAGAHLSCDVLHLRQRIPRGHTYRNTDYSGTTDTVYLECQEKLIKISAEMLYEYH